MKLTIAIVLAASVLGTALTTGCAYGGIAVAGDKAVIGRNDSFLFGILRKVFVCKVTDAGVTNCQTADSP